MLAGRLKAEKKRTPPKEDPQLVNSRLELAHLIAEYCQRFGHEQIICRDDFPIRFKSELEKLEYLIDLYSRCLREGKPLRAYVTPASATFEFKEGIIYK